MPSSHDAERYPGVENRVQFFAVAMTVALAVLGVQLWRLQILNLNYFREKSMGQIVGEQRLKSDRGIIFARDNAVLADNRPSADIVFVPGECPKERHSEVCHSLANILGISASELYDEIESKRGAPFIQILVQQDVTKAERTRIEENAYKLPGVFTKVHPQRRYLHGKTAGQLLGYLAEIGPNQLETWREDGYRQGDLIGYAGIEQQYEQLLHGRDGFERYTRYADGSPQLLTDTGGKPYIATRDTAGNLLDSMGIRHDPSRGGDLHLTLDLDLQEHCENLLGGEAGAIVVLNADTGEVLAMASNPAYDPNVFVTQNLRTEKNVLLQGPKGATPRERLDPLKSLAFKEQTYPGSIYKMVVAAAAIEEGVITPTSTVSCGGSFQMGAVLHCWQRHGHGGTNLVNSLAYSCDVFYYTIAQKLGIDRISAWSHKFGLGERTGIDLPEEAPGLVPNPAWKAEVHKNDKDPSIGRWYPVETSIMAIGQGSTQMTPLQAAAMISTFVNGGYRVRPHLNQGMKPEREKILKDETVEIVKEGLLRCVEKDDYPRGTGQQAKVKGLRVLGKTGTAQVVRLAVRDEAARKNNGVVPWALRHHAWFVAGVIEEDLRIAVSVLILHGEKGSDVASPYAKDVMEYVYADKLKGQHVALAGGE
ncbi:MAG: penicillin-binding protein 2 [Candidatus Hydrogenedentes bacterium]|nr:penicillin-binding protein 2 [Candidatus Hydrogenedentota bacterium]